MDQDSGRASGKEGEEMSECEQCQGELPPGRRQRFCSNECGVAFHNAHRNTEAKKMDFETPPIHQEARQLIVSGHLPLPFSIDPHDGRPVWSFTELAVMFDRRPDELIDLLIQAGPVHLSGDRGIPSSWKMFIER